MRIRLGRPVDPFGEAPGELPVLGIPLRIVQEQALALCGVEMVEKTEGPVLLVGDHTWFTAALIRAFLKKCPPSGGRLAISGPFLQFTKALQSGATTDPMAFPIYWSPQGASAEVLEKLPLVELDLEARMHEGTSSHPVFQGVADQPIPVTEMMAHTVDHWLHVHRVNLLALMALAEGQRLSFERSGWFGKLWKMFGVLLKARSFRETRIAAALTQQGPNCRIHPTATVEASILGSGVEIGPYAVVRGSHLGSGVSVQEHAQVHLSIIEDGAIVGRSAMVRMCLMMAGAMVSKCQGVQASVFGKQSFVAVGATLYDLSFGSPVRVMHHGERVSSGSHFLGVCLGHRAKIGPHVRIGYGESIPNDGFIVADPRTLVRGVEDLEAGEPYAWMDGELRPVRKRPT